MRSARHALRWLAAAVAAVFTAAAAELLLRAAPAAFGQRNLNLVLARYGTQPGDMYFAEPSSRLLLMWPNASLTAYFNGYRWRHRTDALGYRNPRGTRGDDVLLLGDSLVYGHGVEEEETVGHYLRHEHGLRAYNMGRQGNCLWQEYVDLRRHLDSLRPRAVVLFGFRNDFADLFAYREAGEIAAAPEVDAWDYAALEGRIAQVAARRPSRLARATGASATVRLLRGLGWMLAGRTRPVDDEPPPSAATLRLYRRYCARLLSDADRRCRAAGARLYTVELEILAPASPLEQRGTAAAMAAASAAGIVTASTRELFAGCRECFLPGDGHLSPEGHRRLADFVARLVQLPPHGGRPGGGAPLQWRSPGQLPAARRKPATNSAGVFRRDWPSAPRTVREIRTGAEAGPRCQKMAG